MGLIRSAMRASTLPSDEPGRPSETALAGGWWAGGDTSAGVFVSEETALHYSPFFGGVRVLAEDVGSLPLITYERQPRGKRRATEHSLYGVLHDQPNPFMSSVKLRETLQGHAITWGDGFASIVRNGAGDVVELWPLHPGRMRVEITRLGRGRMTLMYRYTDLTNGIAALMFPDEVLHVAGLGGNGIRGYSMVGLARQSIGMGLATEAYGAKFFGSGARPGGVLKHPGTLGRDAKARLREDWEDMHRGLDNAQRVAVLEEGLEWESIGIPPEDAQFLETRRHNVTEMARWLRLPPHKIGDLQHATYSNIEHQALDYVTSSLRIWLVRWEQAITTRLLTSSERARFFAEHLVDGLLRGDIKSRYEAYAIGRNWGWLSADDIAEMENRNPLPDERGSVYLVPLNMVPAPSPKEIEEAKEAAKKAPPPAPAPEPPAPLPEDEDEPKEPPRRLGLRGRGMEGRQRIAQRFAALLAAADADLATWEEAEVAALAERHLPANSSAFLAAIEELYGVGGPVAERTTAAWAPIFAEFAADIAEDAAADVAYTEPVDLADWVTSYVASHVGYRIASELGQLAAQVTAADPLAAVLARLARWVVERPGQISRWQGTQMAAAAARETWRAAGVESLTWVTFGSDDCSLCGSLDGAVVGIAEPFVAKGSDVGDGEEKLTAARSIHHPPLHVGCDCQIVPA
ncbi:phage portal protein [Streptosporangium sp. DT93]|uniref:phage portal protein n=1 Tax=Streptosporangium sp. DT93 TaxID=3393428 RepID=UPI003CED33CA